MAYSHTNSLGVTYYLHTQQVVLKHTGRPVRIYYFSKQEQPRPGATLADLPRSRQVTENPGNGFLALKKFEGGATHEDEEPDAAGSSTPDELALEFTSGTVELGLVGPTPDLVRAPDGTVFEAFPRFFASIARLDRCIAHVERLINATETREADLQAALERCPDLLKVFGHHDAVPHVVLETNDGKLIPDFILRSADHDLCDILELKLPTLPLVVGTETRPRPSALLAKTLSQLRHYAEVLEAPSVQQQVEARYGLAFFRPRLYLIAGRSRQTARRAQVRAVGDYRTDVYTWDEFLGRARARFR